MPPLPTIPSALEIARALIRFPSVTPTDAGALPYLRDLLGRAGFATELVTFEAPGTPAVLRSDRARAHPVSLGDADRRRRAALLARSLGQGRFRHRARHVRSAGNARGPPI